jgi:hypothetical protein
LYLRHEFSFADIFSSPWPYSIRLPLFEMPVRRDEDVERDRQEPEQELEHDWLCARCGKKVSAERPPELNTDNCSCSDLGTPVNDPHLTQARTHLMIDSQGPPSYPNSNDGSVQGQEGLETMDPNKRSRFIPVGPATGLGEAQHRRRASFDDIEEQLASTVTLWLRTRPHQKRSYRGLPWQHTDGEFLVQTTHIVGPTDDSIRATRGHGSGNLSGSQSLSSRHSDVSSGSRSRNLNTLNAMGAWIEEEWEIDVDATIYEDDFED